MPFDTVLADRIRKQLARRKNFAEKKMFGGICFLLNGNICSGVLGDELILRVSPEEAKTILRKKHTRIFDFTGRPGKNMVYIGPKALQTETDLKRFIHISLKFMKSLLPKN